MNDTTSRDICRLCRLDLHKLPMLWTTWKDDARFQSEERFRNHIVFCWNRNQENQIGLESLYPTVRIQFLRICFCRFGSRIDSIMGSIHPHFQFSMWLLVYKLC